MSKHAPIILAYFDSGYARTGVIQLEDELRCDGCGRVTNQVITIDTSESEYAPGNICYNCIHFAVRDDIKRKQQ